MKNTLAFIGSTLRIRFYCMFHKVILGMLFHNVNTNEGIEYVMEDMYVPCCGDEEEKA
jgi:hypothetical protein